jgi:hypothetical protein
VADGSARQVLAAKADLDNDSVDEIVLYTVLVGADNDGICHYFKILDYEKQVVTVNDVLNDSTYLGRLMISSNGFLTIANTTESSEAFHVFEYRNNDTVVTTLTHSEYRFGSGKAPSITYRCNWKEIQQRGFNASKDKYGLHRGEFLTDTENVLGKYF